MLQPDPYDQSLIDSMMLLTLWTRAAPEDGAPSIGDRQRLMKLAFLFSHALSEERIDALGLSFFLTVFSFNIIGDALRDAFDPRLRGA